MKARLIGLVRDFVSKSWHLTISVNDDEITTLFEGLKGHECSFELKKWFEKRSLNANALYWKMCGALAKKLRVPNAEMHNTLLRRYGSLQEIDGKKVYLVLPDTDEAERTALQADTFHIKPTSDVRLGKDDKMYRTYVMLKGSHELDSAEMNRLIDGVLGECKEQGIPTDSPTEIERIKALWANQ